MFQKLTISPARPDEWSAAFEVALQQVPDEQRHTRVLNALALLAAGEVDPRGIFVARHSGTIVGVQVCIPLRGASGLFWLPQVAPGWQNSDLADRLIQNSLAWLRQNGAKLAQSLLHPSGLEHAGPLMRCGFRHITRLYYLRHDLVDLPALPAIAGLRFESFTLANERDFQETLQRTYIDTLDCPELNDIRTIAEVIEGHRAQGICRPETWWLARWEEQPLGVVLLTELFENDGWDLSYVGIVPEFRGRGLGRHLTLHALHDALDHHALQLMVAVDERNAPARRVYESLGFDQADCREVFLQVFPE